MFTKIDGGGFGGVRLGVEAFYNVVRPDSIGSSWGLRFMVIPAVPAALFKWTGL